MAELFQETKIRDCYLYKSSFFKDHRGSFIKMYSEAFYKDIGLNIPIAEVFFSESNKDVIRGMHFQLPPHDQIKVVTCISGSILDVVLDLRRNSSTYGQALGIDLAPNLERTLIIPRGCAHGFYSREENSVVCYAVEKDHHKNSDSGIRWDSFGFRWPILSPIISERDKFLPKLQDFNSPFV